MAINFPSSPTLNQISQVGSNYYIWNGAAWVGYSTSFSLSETVTFATSAGIATNAQGLTGTPNLNVGIVTATSFVGNGSGLTNLVGVGAGIVIKDSGSTVGTAGTIDFGDNLTVSTISAGIVTVTGSTGNAGIATYASNAGIATYASNAGIATYASNAGIATYATSAGIATYATSAGISTYSYNSGIATYATSAGIATYAINAGIATNAQGLTGTPNITVGIITASSFSGDGSGLTGIVGSGSGIVIKDSGSTVGTAGTIDFGDNLSVSAISAGIVTVTGSASGSSQFVTTAAGIHTLSNVGIGTTNPTSKLQIERFGIQSGFGTFSASAGIATDIDTFTISSTNFKTAEYTLHFTNGSNIQAQKVLVMQNGTTSYSQEYAIMFEPNQIVSIGTTISSGICKLQATPETGISGITTYIFSRNTIL